MLFSIFNAFHFFSTFIYFLKKFVLFLKHTYRMKKIMPNISVWSQNEKDPKQNTTILSQLQIYID